MKILLINYAYFVVGGPERYMFHVIQSFENLGHEVIPYSMRSTENRDSPFSKYFASSINTDGSWFFKSNYNLKNTFKQITRTVFSFEVYKKLRELITTEKPDIAYILHYHKKLSPAVILALKQGGVPAVVRISDYLMMCPQAHFFRKNKVCEDCKITKVYSIKNRCVKGSYMASLIWFIAEKIHQLIREREKIDSFVVTNNFMLEKMNSYGIKNKKIVIHTFTSLNAHLIKRYKEKIRYVQLCYVGKISKLKGVDFLLESFVEYSKNNKQIKLVIIGRDEDSIISSFKASYPNIAFDYYPHSSKEKVLKILANSLFTIIPVKWYENLPNVLLESWSVGTPVLSGSIGSMKATIKHEYNGFLFNVNDRANFIFWLKKCINIQATEYEIMQQYCLDTLRSDYSEEIHLKKLIKLFQSQVIYER